MESFFAALGLSAPQTQAALVQGFLNFCGVVLTGSVAIWSWRATRRKEAEEKEAARLERQRDLRLALWSEIQGIWSVAYLEGNLDTQKAALRQAFRDAEAQGKEFTPFVTSYFGSFLLDALTSDFVLLDAEEIEPVVEFYRQIRSVEFFANELRDPRFAAFSPERKERMVGSLLIMIDRTRILAEDSLRALAVTLNLPRHKRLPAMKEKLDTRQ